MTPPTVRRRHAAAVVALAAALAVTAAPIADARPGGGSGLGSRGSRTYSPPAGTNTSPGAAAPIQRSQTQPSPGFNNPGMQAPGQGRRFGGGFMAGLLGAGLLGALVGGGFFGGLGGISSFLGLLLQIALIVGLVMLALRFFRRRQEPAAAGAAGYARSNLNGAGTGPQGAGGQGIGAQGMGGYGGAQAQQPVSVQPADYEAFERILGEVQTAYGREDLGTLRRIATPEMAGYFEEELRANTNRGVVNRISDVKLLQGDLSEAWREGQVEYATVAMRYALKDETMERGSGKIVEHGPSEAKEFWTFLRERGGDRGGLWQLSAIQQGR